MAKADRKALRKRERNAADVIMNNPALRENLDDVQAELALNWSFDQIAALVEQTADLSEKAAGQQIDALVAKLQSSLMQVSLLTKSMPGCTNKLTAAKEYKQFLGTLYRDEDVPSVAEKMMKSFVDDTAKCTAEETFSHFFAIVKKEIAIEK